ncbi:hypothetical protein MOMA_04695 [Moraxella macacae 0408225]|uniref:Uncharacterized protein n=1 Tax=Moraxella macacae 0408225 TaxID=1230338 RepID=L2F9V9_9GAMM|nr:hypothetical protein [Moraxella macacae]ELA09675.1 hypothetical protein MOMA_04695 [Moraxella macacae 0408225]
MRLKFTKDDLNIYPKDLPKGLINALIIACLVLGLAGLRTGRNWQGVVAVLEYWAFMLLWIPTAITICAIPFKLRDDSFELKLAYYLGMFVAFIFIINKLRYLR